MFGRNNNIGSLCSWDYKGGAMKSIPVILILFLLTSCVTHFQTSCVTWYSDPGGEQVENESYKARIETKCISRCNYGGCFGFDLTITNKTKKDLKVNWNQTLYVSNGQTAGGFLFSGDLYEDRISPKKPDIILPNGVFSKTIFPSKHVWPSSAGGTRDRLPVGENGIYLMVSSGKENIAEKIVVEIVHE